MSRRLIASSSTAVCTLFACGLAAPSAALAQTPGFHLMGVGPGGITSTAYGLSADGRTAAGFSSGPGVSLPYTWTLAGGRHDLTLANSGISAMAVFGLSGDGSTLVGSGLGASGHAEAARWRGPGTFQTLGLLPGAFQSYANAVSGDGSVVVGNNEAPQAAATVAFRWTAATGMQIVPGVDLGFSVANAVSADGTKIFGLSDNAFGGSDAFVWSEAGGYQILPSLSGGRTGDSAARGCSLDGLTVVGESDNAQVRWRNGVPQNLGDVPGYSAPHANAVSADGGVVVGQLGSSTAHPMGGSFIWTEALGMTPLDQYLAASGVTVPSGLSLFVNAVSADGNVFAGVSRTADFHIEGFVAVVPAPGTASVIMALTLYSAGRRRRRPPSAR